MAPRKQNRRKALKHQSKSYWQIRFRTPGWGPGNRFEMSSGTTDLKTMEGYKSKLLSLWQQGELELLQAVKDRRVALALLTEWMDKGGVRGAVQEYKAMLAAQASVSPELEPLVVQYFNDPNRKGEPGTRALYDQQIRSFLAYADRELNGPTEGPKAKQTRAPVLVEHLERDRISHWLRAIESAGSKRFSLDKLSPKTVIHHRASLSAFCTWLMEKGLLAANPVLKAYRPRQVKTDPEYMNKEQWQQFLAESEAYDREREFPRPLPCTVWYEFLVATGATTYNEGCTVRQSDIYDRAEPGNPMVRVYLTGTKTTNRQRSVWIPRTLADRVLAYAKQWNRGHQEAIFPYQKWEGHHHFERVCERLTAKGLKGFDELSPYSLRHTYAVAMIVGDPENGIPGTDIVSLARLMGHGDNWQTTWIYARHVGDHSTLASRNMARAMGLDRPPPAQEPE